MIEGWRKHDNTLRPHSSLGYVPPAPEVQLWPAAQPKPAPPATPAVALRPVMHLHSNRTTSWELATVRVRIRNQRESDPLFISSVELLADHPSR